MKKSANVDIQSLFGKFDGNPENYKELKREDNESRALQRWPIVAAMRNELQRGHGAGVQAEHPLSPVASVPSLVQTARSAVAERSVQDIRPSQEAPIGAPVPVSSFAATRSPLLSGGANAQGSVAPVASTLQAGERHAQSVQADKSGKKATLSEVFSRLNDSPIDGDANSPRNSLRSMLGFLKK